MYFNINKCLANPDELESFEEYHRFYDIGQCWSCGAIVGKENLEIGHLIDRVCGGRTDWNNLRPMCIGCNRLWKPLHDSFEEVMDWREKQWANYKCLKELDKEFGGFDGFYRRYIQCFALE